MKTMMLAAMLLCLTGCATKSEPVAITPLPGKLLGAADAYAHGTQFKPLVLPWKQ